MTDPLWTVVLLVVLWLIVIVPMVLRRRDQRAGQRSVARFGASMRALSRRSVVESEPLPQREGSEDHRPAVFGNGNGAGATAITRRPVPAAEESLMYPPDEHEMSTARRQMMARRRRSLTVLGAGTAIFLLLALITGSTVAWVLAVLFVACLGGYLFFLRSQARRDRERRQARRQRSSGRSGRDYDATERDAAAGRYAHGENDYERSNIADANGADGPHRAESARRGTTKNSIVRIDEDDVSLDHLDTVDLTGLYSEVELEDRAVRRAG